MAWLVVFVALLSGAANPVQSAAHGQLNKQLGQTVWATVVIYTVGLLGALAIQLFARQPVPLAAVGRVNWWAWCGGLISIISTMAALTLVQRLGSGLFTSIGVTASLIVSMLLDKFGWLGLEKHPLSTGRLIGCGLLVGGVWLVGRS